MSTELKAVKTEVQSEGEWAQFRIAAMVEEGMSVMWRVLQDSR